MKITVLGAGAIGSAIAHDLIHRDAVSEVQVCDAHSRALKMLHKKIQDAKLQSFQIDARDVDALRPILEGSACVIGCVSPQLNPSLAALSLSMGVHFCDLGGNDDIVKKELALDEQAREQGVWIVPNCGLSPGLVNILCVLGLSQFDEVEAAHIRVGNVPLHPKPPFNFRVAWSARKLIDDYTNPVHMIEHGKRIECTPLSGLESLSFPEPFGQMEAFYTAGSLSSLSTTLEDKVHSLDHKTIRWPGHASQMQFLLGLGFGEARSIDVRTHLTYQDLLIRRMTQRLGGDHQDAVLLRVLVRGLQGGKKATLVYEMIDQFDQKRDLSAMKRCTSIPTATVAIMLAAGQAQGSGAAPPEQVVPKAMYCALLAERGLEIGARWLDGYVDVRDTDMPMPGNESI